MAEEDPPSAPDIPWTEKYRPKKLDEVFGQKEIVERMKAYARHRNVPHMMFSGPPGTGKCITGDTLVVFEDGAIRQIKEVVKESLGKNTKFAYLDGYACSGHDKGVASLDRDGLKIRPGRISAYSEFPCKTVYAVTTRTGKVIRTTAEHPFFVAGRGGIGEVSAEKLKPGDYIACARRLPPVGGAGRRLHLELLDERFFVKLNDGSLVPMRNFLGRFEKRVAASFIYFDKPGPAKRKSMPSLWKMSGELAEWIGYILADGHLGKEDGEVAFFTEEDEVKTAFSDLTARLFGETPSAVFDKRRKHLYVMRIHSKTIWAFISQLFGIPKGNKSRRIDVPEAICTASNGEVAGFLRAVFESESHVSKNGCIELTMASDIFVSKLQYLLLRFGIICTRRTRNVRGWKYASLRISEQTNLRRFAEAIGFISNRKAERLDGITNRKGNPNLDVIPGCLYEDLYEAAAFIRSYDIKEVLRPYRFGLKAVSPDTLRKLAKELGKRIENKKAVCSKEIEKLRKALHNYLEYAEITAQLRDELLRLGVSYRKVAYYGGVSEETVRRFINSLVDETYLENLRRICVGASAVTDEPEMDANLRGLYETLELQNDIRTAITNSISALNISRALLESKIGLGKNNLTFLLKCTNTFIPRGVVERLMEELERELARQVSYISLIQKARLLADADIFWDKVSKVERTPFHGEVYDLSVAGDMNFVAGEGGIIVHNTTLALALAHEIYGERWHDSFRELNASDERGIDVVRGTIKDFARTLPLTDVPFKIIFLDESDALTPEAQNALRRTMEMYAGNTRFILSNNYSSKIIEPIQSRCAVFRFRPLSEKDIHEMLHHIARCEKLELKEDAVKALIYVSEGDMRKAINALQGAAAASKSITGEAVFKISSRARPEEVRQMLELALKGDFIGAREKLDNVMLNYGMSGEDVMLQMYKEISALAIPDRTKVALVDKIGEYNFRLVEGANERIQLEALLAQVLLLGSEK